MIVRLIPQPGFGRFELRGADGTPGEDIPTWLIDRPDVLKALTILAERGGNKHLRVPDHADVQVDTYRNVVSYVDDHWKG